MRLWLAAILGVALVSQTASYRAAVDEARASRIAELTADDGWLTVTGLFWLKPGRNLAGSGPGSSIRLPSKAPPQVGVFDLANGRITFTAADGVTVTSGGAPVRSRAMDTSEGDRTALAIGDLRMFVIQREDRYAVRLRDMNSAMRRAFKGLEYFPVSESYRVDARFTAYPEPRTIRVPNVLGRTPGMVSPGYVTFSIAGAQVRLEPVYETDERQDLFFIFKDGTSRDATYPAGRFLHAPLPENGKVTIDFNLAYNPPCAFTDFATCPLPPKQNQLAVRIEAGEKAYHAEARAAVPPESPPGP